MPSLLVIVRWLWPLALPLCGEAAVAALLIGASQYHLWSRLSSGSVFAPELPRPVVIVFDWAFGASLLLIALQLMLDLGTLLMILVLAKIVGEPARLRYAIAGVVAVLAAASTGSWRGPMAASCRGRYDVDGMTLSVNDGQDRWPGCALRLGLDSEDLDHVARIADNLGPSATRARGRA